jgi:hypothetical protein
MENQPAGRHQIMTLSRYGRERVAGAAIEPSVIRFGPCRDHAGGVTESAISARRFTPSGPVDHLVVRQRTPRALVGRDVESPVRRRSPLAMVANGQKGRCDGQL